MSTRLNIRLTDEHIEILKQYCKRMGVTKTGTLALVDFKDEKMSNC